MLLKNGTVCDYAQERKADVRIDGGKIVEVCENILPRAGEEVLECDGYVIMPALIDMASPKNKTLSRKTLQSLTQKALSGGVGSVLLRPDSTPRIDSESIIELVLSLDSALNVHFLPSIAPYKDGRIVEIASLVANGAYAIFLESGIKGGIEGYALHKIAQYAQMLEVPIIASPQESSLSDGAMNEGMICAELGLPGISSLAQTIEVARFCEMARFSQTKWVLDVISEKESLDIIAFFRQFGAQILTQTSIHHLILSDEHCRQFDTRFKLFPPLKDSGTRDFLCSVLESHIDMLTCLQSDSYKSLKDQVFESASFGINAFEIYLALGIEYLVKPKLISLSRFSELTSYAQAQLLKLPKGAIEQGKDADLVIVDCSSYVEVSDMSSPYYGQKLAGKVVQTLVAGKVYTPSSLANK